MKFSELLEEIKLKHGEEPDENFDPRDLKVGIRIEMEHTSDPNVAKQIAKAHLSEFPHYYTSPKGLLNMEKKLKGEKKIVSKSTEKRLAIQKGDK
jgi:hypothetical protein